MEAAAAAEAAEAAVDSLGLDSVGVDVHATDGDDEMALAAAGELMFAVKNIGEGTALLGGDVSFHALQYTHPSCASTFLSMLINSRSSCSTGRRWDGRGS